MENNLLRLVRSRNENFGNFFARKESLEKISISKKKRIREEFEKNLNHYRRVAREEFEEWWNPESDKRLEKLKFKEGEEVYIHFNLPGSGDRYSRGNPMGRLPNHAGGVDWCGVILKVGEGVNYEGERKSLRSDINPDVFGNVDSFYNPQCAIYRRIRFYPEERLLLRGFNLKREGDDFGEIVKIESVHSIYPGNQVLVDRGYLRITNADVFVGRRDVKQGMMKYGLISGLQKLKEINRRLKIETKK